MIEREASPQIGAMSDPFARQPDQRSAHGRSVFLALKEQLEKSLTLSESEAEERLCGDAPSNSRRVYSGTSRLGMTPKQFLNWHALHQASSSKDRVNALHCGTVRQVLGVFVDNLRRGGVRMVGQNQCIIYLVLREIQDRGNPNLKRQIIHGFIFRERAENFYYKWSGEYAGRSTRSHILPGQKAFRAIVTERFPNWENDPAFFYNIRTGERQFRKYIRGQSVPDTLHAGTLAKQLNLSVEEIIAACKKSKEEADRLGNLTITEWRIRRGYSVEDLARHTKIGVNTLSLYESGSIPKRKKYKGVIAKALGVGISNIKWGFTDEDVKLDRDHSSSSA